MAAILGGGAIRSVSGFSWITNNSEFLYSMCPKPMSPKTRKNPAELSEVFITERPPRVHQEPGGRGVLCGQLVYVFRDFCLKQGIEFTGSGYEGPRRTSPSRDISSTPRPPGSGAPATVTSLVKCVSPTRKHISVRENTYHCEVTVI